MHTYMVRSDRHRHIKAYSESSSSESTGSYTVVSCKSDSFSDSVSSSPSTSRSCDTTDDIVSFQPIITPLIDIMVNYGRNVKCPTFTLYHRDNLVVLTWEPFSGKISESGVDSLLICQTIKWLPSYPLELPIIIYYKGIRCNGLLSILLNTTYQLKLVFPEGTCVRVGDSVRIPGGTATWIY